MTKGVAFDILIGVLIALICIAAIVYGVMS